ncbi:guanylate kinase [Candidatus Poriferisodalis sp.]|uniref:guanylate kinase n=1 Tax=Candidatus Poriferisodalis sp. TaxID=3101277 RepID=UPI003D1227BE
MTAPAPDGAANPSATWGVTLYVVCGPGGAGKGTIVAELVARDPTLLLSRSWTTRPRRVGESAEAYTFVMEEEFDARIAEGGFLEWADFFEHRYGTPMPPRDLDRDLVLEIDVQGAVSVRNRDPAALVIMVLPPSRAEQERRMRRRGDPDSEVFRRLVKADEELPVGYRMADLIVVNRDIGSTVDEIAAFVDRTRSQRPSSAQA